MACRFKEVKWLICIRVKNISRDWGGKIHEIPQITNTASNICVVHKLLYFFLLNTSLNPVSICSQKQVSVPVACVPPACRPCVWQPPPAVNSRGGVGTLDIRTPLNIPTPPGPGIPSPPPKGPGNRDTTPQKGPRTRDTHSPSPWTDTRLWKHYLPPTSLAGGNNSGALPCPAENFKFSWWFYLLVC